MNSLLKDSVKKLEGSGAWAPICSNHVYSMGAGWNSPSFNVPENSNFTLNEVVKRWINKEVDPMLNAHIDEGNWPANKPCSGEKVSSW